MARSVKPEPPMTRRVRAQRIRLAKEIAMTELQKYRAEYGPIRLGITRVLLACLTAIAGIYLNFRWLTGYTTAAIRVQKFDGVSAIGLLVLAVLVMIAFYAFAWMLLGFKNPFSFIRRVWRINWRGHNSVQFWMEGSKLYHSLEHNNRLSGPPTTATRYSLLKPLAVTWGPTQIVDWVNGGVKASGLKARMCVASAEGDMFGASVEADMVWLKDRIGSSILVTLNEALEWWIPLTLEQGEYPSLTVTSHKMHKLIHEKEGDIAVVRRMSREDQAKFHSAVKRIFSIRDQIGQFISRVDQSRRLKFHKEAEPIIASMRVLHDDLHRDPLGEKKPSRSDIRGDLA